MPVAAIESLVELIKHSKGIADSARFSFFFYLLFASSSSSFVVQLFSDRTKHDLLTPLNPLSRFLSHDHVRIHAVNKGRQPAAQIIGPELDLAVCRMRSLLAVCH